MTLEQIKKLIAEFKGIKTEITADTTFQSLGLDSLDIVDLVMKIEDESGVSIEMNENLKTVGNLLEYIAAAKKN